MIVSLLLAALMGPACPPPDAWSHDRSVRLSRDQRVQVFERIADRLKLAGASKDATHVALLVAWRESRGDTCASHDGGTGSGAFGMKHKYYGTRKELVIPEVAAMRFYKFLRRAKNVRKAKTWKRANQIYAGRNTLSQQDPLKDVRFCQLLKRRRIDCEAPVRL